MSNCSCPNSDCPMNHSDRIDPMIETKVFPAEDPRLGWRSSHDARSLDYPVRALLGPVGALEDRPREWKPGAVLDQGREGACVGFAWTGELLASPRPSNLNALAANGYASSLYREAQKIDEWPGENYSGTSVLAGAKILQERGLIDGYRWALGIEDVRDSVIAGGPVVLGIPWYSGMYSTRPSGLVEVSGEVVGGHAILVYGYHPGMRIRGEGWNERHRVFRWRNSWGSGYGRNGSGLIRYEDLRDLLAVWGEACVPVGRKYVNFGAPS